MLSCGLQLESKALRICGPLLSLKDLMMGTFFVFAFATFAQPSIPAFHISCNLLMMAYVLTRLSKRRIPRKSDALEDESGFILKTILI